MSRGGLIVLVLLCITGFLLGFLGGVVGTGIGKDDTSQSKTVTVQKTVPGPERTVEVTVRGKPKKQPGTTTWIIVCGEQTQRIVNTRPTTECKLPDTGP